MGRVHVLMAEVQKRKACGRYCCGVCLRGGALPACTAWLLLYRCLVGSRNPACAGGRMDVTEGGGHSRGMHTPAAPARGREEQKL